MWLRLRSATSQVSLLKFVEYTTELLIAEVDFVLLDRYSLV